MGQYIINLTEEEEKALLTDMISIQEWIENAIKNKARQCIDDIVEKSGRGSKYTEPNKKIEIIRQLIKEKSPLLKTAEERQREFEEILKKGNA